MTGVVIVGGGITGLAAAHWLQQNAPGLPITVLEGSHRLGGKVVTERVDGFIIEGGPDTFLARKPRGVGLCEELGLGGSLMPANPHQRRTYLLRGGQLRDLPAGLAGLLPTRAGPLLRSPLLSAAAKVRLGLEFFVRPRPASGDESLAGFVTRRLGPEMYDRLVEPLLSGIYAGDGHALSLEATFPQLRQHELQHGGLIRAMRAQRRANAPGQSDSGATRSAFVAPAGGVGAMIEALETRLRAAGVSLRLGQAVVEVQADGRGYRLALADGTNLTAAAVILAVPAPAAARLLAGLDSALAGHLKAIQYASTATISLAYRLADVPRPLDGYGYLIPRAEGRPVLACTFTSTKFPGRAPQGMALLRLFVGRAGQEQVLEADDAALAALARDEVRRTLGVTAQPLLQRVFRWPNAMPQYNLGHPERVQEIERAVEAYPGLFLAGAAYRGVGLPDCIASGEAAAQSALAALALKPEDSVL